MYRKQSHSQKLVIPQGTILPGEAVVVEIPRRFKRAPMIVVKKRPGELGRARAGLHFIEGPTDAMYPANYPQMQRPPNQPICPGMLPLPQQQQCPMPQQQICPATTMPQSSATQPQVCPATTMPQTMPQQQICPAMSQCPSNFYFPSGLQCPGQMSLPNEEMMEKLMFSRSLEKFQKARRMFLGSANMMRGRLSQCPSTLSCASACDSCYSSDSFD